jgi:hypothetical protein
MTHFVALKRYSTALVQRAMCDLWTLVLKHMRPGLGFVHYLLMADLTSATCQKLKRGLDASHWDPSPNLAGLHHDSSEEA